MTVSSQVGSKTKWCYHACFSDLNTAMCASPGKFDWLDLVLTILIMTSELIKDCHYDYHV